MFWAKIALEGMLILALLANARVFAFFEGVFRIGFAKSTLTLFAKIGISTIDFEPLGSNCKIVRNVVLDSMFTSELYTPPLSVKPLSNKLSPSYISTI